MTHVCCAFVCVLYDPHLAVPLCFPFPLPPSSACAYCTWSFGCPVICTESLLGKCCVGRFISCIDPATPICVTGHCICPLSCVVVSGLVELKGCVSPLPVTPPHTRTLHGSPSFPCCAFHSHIPISSRFCVPFFWCASFFIHPLTCMLFSAYGYIPPSRLWFPLLSCCIFHNCLFHLPFIINSLHIVLLSLLAELSNID